ncbi:MAG: hypothetical protein JNM31_08070 [Flavobacteriales bacterium]|nr:hypothetical protein [Flavobacteriales bacterium]
MSSRIKIVLAILAATVWISLSEFVRNEFLLKAHWVSHYQAMGQEFPAAPINGIMWGVWSLFFASAIAIISTRFDLLRTAALAWLVGFVLMWMVIGNLGVLPTGILPIAIPLSMLEAFVAAWIIKKLR